MKNSELFDLVQRCRNGAGPVDLYLLAELVAAHERERCAKVCDEVGGAESKDCAAAIRALKD